MTVVCKYIYSRRQKRRKHHNKYPKIISYECKRGNHNGCTSLNCICKCHNKAYLMRG